MRVSFDEGKFVNSDQEMGGTAFTMKASASGFKTVIDSLYRFKEMAVVRETISNAADSHSERDKLLTPAIAQPSHYNSVYTNQGLQATNKGWLAPIGTPIKIHAPTSDEPYFEVEDFGVGLTIEDVIGKPTKIEKTETHVVNGHEVEVPTGEFEYVFTPSGQVVYDGGMYTTIFDSPKETSNDQIGGFGLGCKSPLAVSEMFTVTIRKDGEKHIIVMYLNPKGEPYADLVTRDEKGFPKPIPMVEGEDYNGVTVNVPVSEERFKKFESSLSAVLRFMHGNFLVEGQKLKIEKPKFFDTYHKTGFVTNGHGMHYAVQGGVVYPIETYELSGALYYFFKSSVNDTVDTYTFFDIGELSVQPSREDLQYDNRSLENLTEKLETAVIEIEEELKNHGTPVLVSDRFRVFQNYHKIFRTRFISDFLPKKLFFGNNEVEPVSLELENRKITIPENGWLASYTMVEDSNAFLEKFLDTEIEPNADPFIRYKNRDEKLQIQKLVGLNTKTGEKRKVVVMLTDGSTKSASRFRSFFAGEGRDYDAFIYANLYASFYHLVRKHLGIRDAATLIREELKGEVNHGIQERFKQQWKNNKTIKEFKRFQDPEDDSIIIYPDLQSFGALERKVEQYNNEKYGYNEKIVEILGDAFGEYGVDVVWLKDHKPYNPKGKSKGKIKGVRYLCPKTTGFQTTLPVSYETLHEARENGEKIVYLETSGFEVDKSTEKRLKEYGIRFGGTLKYTNISPRPLTTFAFKQTERGRLLGFKDPTFISVGKTGRSIIEDYDDVLVSFEDFIETLVASVTKQDKKDVSDLTAYRKAFSIDQGGASLTFFKKLITSSSSFAEKIGMEPKFGKYYHALVKAEAKIISLREQNDWISDMPDFLYNLVFGDQKLEAEQERHVERRRRFYLDLAQEIEEYYHDEIRLAKVMLGSAVQRRTMHSKGSSDIIEVNQALLHEAEVTAFQYVLGKMKLLGPNFMVDMEQFYWDKSKVDKFERPNSQITMITDHLLTKQFFEDLFERNGVELGHSPHLKAVNESGQPFIFYVLPAIRLSLRDYIKNDELMLSKIYRCGRYSDLTYSYLSTPEMVEREAPEVFRELTALADEIFKCLQWKANYMLEKFGKPEQKTEAEELVNE